MPNVFGAKLSKLDLRDYKICGAAENVNEFILDKLPPVKNQGSISSCVAHASSSILEWFNTQELKRYMELSTRFIYGMQGILCNRVGSGMYLRDACKIVKEKGDCLVESIPNNIEMPEAYKKLKDEVTPELYEEAKIACVRGYARCTTDKAIKYALQKKGPVLASVKWRKKYTLRDGVINFDTKSSASYHAVMVYGFNEVGWLCQNSWGAKWGKEGRFILPYDYGFAEAWSFTDTKNSDVYKPKLKPVYDAIDKANKSLIEFAKKIKR